MPADLTREKLYLDVWTYPLGRLSRKLGVPTYSLREACQVMAVPLPPFAYWPALKAGEAPPPPVLAPHNGPNTFSLGGPSDEVLTSWAKPARHESLLSVEDVAILTGRNRKSLQCDALRLMRIPFAVGITGEPLVPVSGIEGRAKQAREEVAELGRHFAKIWKSIGNGR